MTKKVKGCRFCYLSDDEKVLMKTENFYVIPSIGSIVEGYLLLNTKYHINSYGNMDENLLYEFIIIKKEIKKILDNLFKKSCIFFEHGRAGVSTTFENTNKICYHAHLHCVATNVDLFKRICKDYKPIILKEYKELLQLTKEYPDYLYYENKKIMVFFPIDIYIRPQYLRSILAEELNKPNEADWRKVPNWKNVKKTIKKLQYYFQNI